LAGPWKGRLKVHVVYRARVKKGEPIVMDRKRTRRAERARQGAATGARAGVLKERPRRLEDLPDILTPEEATAWLRLRVQRPIAALRRTGIPLCRIAGHVRVRRTDLASYIAYANGL